MLSQHRARSRMLSQRQHGGPFLSVCMHVVTLPPPSSGNASWTPKSTDSGHTFYGPFSPCPLLRAFRQWPGPAAVVAVSCCYNLLTEGSGGAPGFPLTHNLAEKKAVIGRAGRDLACQVSTTLRTRYLV